jgi:beta-mannosidase
VSYTPLHDGWTLKALGPTGASLPDEAITATVPGCVHTDLLGAGLIPDPFLDDNEVRLAWIGLTDWEYETHFDAPPGPADRVDLAFAGLDTVATLTLNGVELGRTFNMHREYRFDTAGALRPGRNTLRVRFDSAVSYGEAQQELLGARPGAYDEPFNFIRKMACNFGWDWGPKLVTAGIWRPVGLDAWSTARLAQVRPQVHVDGDTGRVDVAVELERVSADRVVVTASVGGVVERVVVAAGATAVAVCLTVPEPGLWWPRGYGEQRRYPLTVELSTEAGGHLDGWERSIGFRTVELDTAPDAHGSPYTVIINGLPIFVRGVNWIPDDPFPSRITRDRLATRLRQAAGANLNYLRIWGGGRYESEDFYELCDELGLMVGQDFLFACAAYPEEEPFAAEVEAEARHQVVRLAPYPSLVSWTGNNENIWGFHDWQWQERLQGRTWGAGYYFDLLPRIIAELDPTRPYWPGSPYSGREDIHPNDPAYGTMHQWEVWNRLDYARYRDDAPRFMAEFGYQAPPTYATLRRSINDQPLTPDSLGMVHHQKAIDGQLKLRRGLAAHLPEPRDFDDWHYLTQVNQARAVQLGVEHYRSLRPLCMGAIVWQLNDCWPVTSWAAVDGDGRLKPLWYALRRMFADRLITVQPRDGGLAVIAVNDATTRWTAQVAAARVNLSGEPRAKTTIEIDIPPGSAATFPLPDDVAVADDATGELVIVDAGPTRAWWFFAEDKDIDYPAADYDATVEPVDGGLRVTVSARTILRDVTLFPDRLEPSATVDDALVNLLPGESVVFTVTTAAPLSPEALTTRPVLRCVNDHSERQVHSGVSVDGGVTDDGGQT